jgi:penicillin-binding protein 1A
MKEIGVSPVIALARRLGITAELAPDLSLALGSSGVSLLEMSGAYAVQANGGGAVTPYGITKIATLNGELYYQRPDRRSFRRVVESRPVRDITNMLENVIEDGTGRGADFGKRAAGKTGTSQDSRDAWFIGFTDELVTGVWLGNDDNSPMEGVTGGSYPARIWREIMSKGDGLYEPDRRSLFPSGSFENLLGRLIPVDRDKSTLPESRRYNN